MSEHDEILLQNCPDCGQPYYLAVHFNKITKMFVDFIGYCKNCKKIVSTKEEE